MSNQLDLSARQHFLLHEAISTAMKSLEFEKALGLIAQRDAIAKILVQSGWDEYAIGANALGITPSYFRELVKEGTYRLGIGMPAPSEKIEVTPDSDARVKQQLHDAEARRLSTTTSILQANGRPFKLAASAKKLQLQFGLDYSHEIAPIENGFELKRLSMAAQAEKRRIAEGRESWIEAQTAILAEMKIVATPSGEIDATEEQWVEIESRTKARLDGQPSTEKRVVDAVTVGPQVSAITDGTSAETLAPSMVDINDLDCYVAVQGDASNDKDDGVQGVYLVKVKLGQSVSLKALNVAQKSEITESVLDCFHSHQGIEELDDFTIRVFLSNGQEIHEEDDKTTPSPLEPTATHYGQVSGSDVPFELVEESADFGDTHNMEQPVA